MIIINEDTLINTTLELPSKRSFRNVSIEIRRVPHCSIILHNYRLIYISVNFKIGFSANSRRGTRRLLDNGRGTSVNQTKMELSKLNTEGSTPPAVTYKIVIVTDEISSVEHGSRHESWI